MITDGILYSVTVKTRPILLFSGSSSFTVFISTVLWKDRGPRKAIPKWLDVEELINFHFTYW